MAHKKIIDAIDKTFDTMEKNDERVIKLFKFDEAQLFVSEAGMFQAHFAEIALVKKNDDKVKQKFVKLIYRFQDAKNPNGHFRLFPYDDTKGKKQIVKFLKANNIMPSPQEFKDGSGKKSIIVPSLGFSIPAQWKTLLC